MRILEILLLGIGLSMDAFAVSICKGLSVQKLQLKHYLIIGAWFGGFQALMPTIGYFLGSTFEQYIAAFDHWVAFVLLAAIGTGMIKESLSKEETDGNASFSVKIMFVLALATSIDALAVGITFALLPDVNVPLAVTLIGITTFVFSAAGLKVGNLFGTRYKAKAEPSKRSTGWRCSSDLTPKLRRRSIFRSLPTPIRSAATLPMPSAGPMMPTF